MPRAWKDRVGLKVWHPEHGVGEVVGYERANRYHRAYLIVEFGNDAQRTNVNDFEFNKLWVFAE